MFDFTFIYNLHIWFTIFTTELKKQICMKKVVAGIDIDVIVNVGDLSMKNVGILK